MGQLILPQFRHKKHLLTLHERSNNSWHIKLLCIHYTECFAQMCQTSGCYYARHFEQKMVYKLMTYYQWYVIMGILMYVKWL
jgi:hypothetical protein